MHRAALLVCLGSLVACGKTTKGDHAPPAVATTGAVAGQVVEASGTVTATRGGASRSLAVGDAVHDDDAIATGADGRIAIKLERNAVTWRLGPNMNQVVAQSTAWTAPKADEGVAGISGDRSAAAGRNAEREAADTAASAARPEAAMAAPADTAPAAAMEDPLAADQNAAAPKHPKTGARRTAADPLADVLRGNSDDDGLGSLGYSGTGPGGGGASTGGGIGTIGGIQGGGISGGGGGAPRSGSASDESAANTASADAPPELQATATATATAASGEEGKASRSYKIAPPAPPAPIAAPTIVCERGSLTVSGPRPRDQIAALIARTQIAFGKCAVDGNEAAAHAMLAFSIGADGKLHGIAVTGASAAFATCVTGAVGTLAFPAATGADTTVKQALEIKR